MPPDLPINRAESPDNSRLNLEPQPRDSDTNGGSNPKHLPSEVLIFIAQNCQDKDLGKLCLVSKHMQSIARQELYRTVVISTDTRLSRFYRTIEEEPVFGQYYVEELKCLAPVDVFRYTKSFVGTLKRLPNLRRLTIALVGRATTVFPSPAIWEVRFALGDSIWDIFTRSQRLGSTSAILPRLQQVRLIPDTRSQNPHERLSHARILNPLLRLPSLSHLELLNDSGVWTRNFCLVGRSKQTTMFDEPHYQQIKSVVLRESDCCPAAIMHILKIFCDMQAFFFQNRLVKSLYGNQIAADSVMLHGKVNQSERYYLPDFLEISPYLKTLALVPIGDKDWAENVTRGFLGPHGFLNLSKLRSLESLSALITLFASPDGETTGLLTVSPVAVLPASLKQLDIVVDYESLMGETPLNEAWFQPREAALQFLETLASVCSTAFPNLRRVEYIYAVDRSSEDVERGGMNPPDAHSPEDPGSIRQTWDCDGSVPLCCDMHTSIQALSPEEDYTSKAQGIFSPFITRFNNLHLALEDANVSFQIFEIERYSDYFFFWKGK